MISLMHRSINPRHISIIVKRTPAFCRRSHNYIISAKNYSRANVPNNIFCDHRLDKSMAVLARLYFRDVRCNTFRTCLQHRLRVRCLQTSSSYYKSEINQNLEIIGKTSEPGWLQSIKGRASPYLKLMRYDRLTGTYLLIIPCTWSIVMAYDPALTTLYETFKTWGWFVFGSFIMRSAGCIINDMMDKDIDAKVSRTKDRPLANERLSQRQALMLLAAHLSAGLGVLLQLNWLSVIVGAPSVILVALYPLAKRYTHLAQVVLGSVWSWSIILGSTAVTDTFIPGTVVPMYLAVLMWNVHYDTIYAHQDRCDDVQIGLKSTAILISGKAPETTPEGRLKLRATLACLTSITMTGAGLSIIHATQGAVSPALTALLLSPAAAHFVWQIATLNEDDPDHCMKKFKSNVHVGLIILAAMLTAKIIQEKKRRQVQAVDLTHTILAVA